MKNQNNFQISVNGIIAVLVILSLFFLALFADAHADQELLMQKLAR